MVTMIAPLLLASCAAVLVRGDSSSQQPPTNGHSMAGPSLGLVVNTTQGLVRGTKHILGDTGRLVTTWLGIPYAEPPLGPRRFQPPQPKEPWSGVLETVSLGPACPQSAKFSVSSANVTSEDCLHLNIYSAEPQDLEQPRPVMVWLHPGEFNYGSAAAVNPARLAATGEVMVVTVQYRLGALGFLYTGGSLEQSNAGLRDQLAALGWVARNILAFGGDPTRVTLFGAEAGAVSASYHVANVRVSGAGLVHAAILQSGGPRSPWARLDTETALRRGAQLATKLGCPDMEQDCLQGLAVEDIVGEQDSVCGLTIAAPSCFVPVEDGDTVQLRAAPAPATRLMYGHNANEGFLKLMQFLTREFPTEKLYSEGFSQEIFLKMLSRMFPEADNKTLSTIDFLYEDIEAPTKASMRFLKLEKIVSDFMSTCSGPEGPGHYRYRFSWQPSKDKWPRWSGVKQGDELQFVFGDPLDSPQDYLIEEKEFSKAVMKLWAEFARTGELVNVTGLHLADFSPELQLIQLSALKSGLVPQSGEQLQKCRFWNDLYEKLLEVDSKCVLEKNVKEALEDVKIKEIQTNEISQDAPSLRTYSPVYVEEPKSKSVRKERGLYQNVYSNSQQFIYKVKTKNPNYKKNGSATAVLEKSKMNQKVYKRQIKPENNTQLSYQLSVGLNNDHSQGEPFAVYNTQQLGNSPIYIAPSKYQHQDPIFNDGSLDTGYRGQSNNYVRGTRRPAPALTPAPVRVTTGTRAPAPAPLDYSQGYDPFFPGFGAKLQTRTRAPARAAAIKQPAAAVSLGPEPSPADQPRSYFPI